MQYNFNILISKYRSAMDHTGEAVSLADFMRLGKDVYYADIMAYRTLKASLAEQRQAKAAYEKELDECRSFIEANRNPLGGEESADVRTELDRQREIEKAVQQINVSIERLTEQADGTKRKLPCATLSGLFSPTRAKANLVHHSGFICVDIDDHIVYTDAEGNRMSVEQSLVQVTDTLRQLPYVLYASHSVGGAGYFALIPLGPIDEQHTHEWYFDCLKSEFEQYGIVIDKACRDTTRLRFVSYDPSPIRNAAAVPYTGVQKFVSANLRREQEREMQRKAEMEAGRMRYGHESGDDLSHAEICIDEIEKRHLNYVESYDMWFTVGCALSSGFGEQGREMFHIMSRQSAKYNRADCDRKYTSLLKRSGSTTTVSTLFDIFEHPERDKYGLAGMQPLRWYEIVKNRRAL